MIALKFGQWRLGPTARVAALASLLAVGAGGCASGPRLTVLQRHAPADQRRLELTGGDAVTAIPKPGRRICVLGFPLPGSNVGPRDFVVYLECADTLGQQPIQAPAAGDDRTVRPAQGFFVQEVGALAGKTPLVDGRVVLERSRFENVLTITLQATCRDGTKLTGKLRLLPDEEAVRRYVRQYRADIAAMRAGAG